MDTLPIIALVAAGLTCTAVALVLFVVFVQPLWAATLLNRITPQVLYRVKTRAPLVALSFDDGPHPDQTHAVLDILGRNGARATFFLIGDRAARHPAVVTEMRAGGHEIGNHYLYYRNGLMLAHSDDEFARRLRDVERQLGLPEGAGAGVKLFRAPGGLARKSQLRRARQMGYTAALGSAYPHDPWHPPRWYLRWLLKKNLERGTIVILHDGIKDASGAIRVLPEILEEGRRRGLRFVSIGELIAARSEDA
jgi:peptidoglycan/xylan/chitin deacetylase (PgdA/CDA1 family)